MKTQFQREARLTSTPISHRELIAAGYTERDLRSPRRRRTSYGFYALNQSGRLSPAQRIIDALPHVPASGAIGGWAAAYLLGVDWFDGRSPFTGQDLPLLIHLGTKVGRGQHVSVRYSRHRLPVDDVVDLDGIRSTSPLRTAFDCVRLSGSATEALVAADAMLHFAVVSVTELVPYVQAHPGWIGVELARWALRMADGKVLSPWESRLRHTYRFEAKLPVPLVNPRLLTSSGSFLAQPDLFDPEAGLAVEFDGADHRARVQHHADNVREELLESHGAVVARVDSLGLGRDRRATVASLQDAYRRGLRRDRRYDNWRVQTE